MKVNVKIPKHKANNEAYRHPVEVFVDDQFIVSVKWVNGPPYYSVEAVDEITPRRAVGERQAAEVERLKAERDEAHSTLANQLQVTVTARQAVADMVVQRNTAEQRTAEAIAAWLFDRADAESSSPAYAALCAAADRVRDGAWRKINEDK